MKEAIGPFVLLAVCLISSNTVNGESHSPPAGSSDSEILLTGTLVGQGNTRKEALGSIPERNVEEVQGDEIAEDLQIHVEPKDELEQGKLLKNFDKQPANKQVQEAIVNSRVGPVKRGPSYPVERVAGVLLDDNVQTGRYVPNPMKVFAELLQKATNKYKEGDHDAIQDNLGIDFVKGNVIAGDPTYLDVITDKSEDPVAKLFTADTPDGKNTTENEKDCRMAGEVCAYLPHTFFPCCDGFTCDRFSNTCRMDRVKMRTGDCNFTWICPPGMICCDGNCEFPEPHGSPCLGK